MISRAEREWRRMRVLAEDRVALRDELRMELTASAADGIPPDELIGPEVARFARDLATSAGVRLVSVKYRRLLLAGLVGAVPGLVVAWFLAWRWWLVPLELDLFTRFSICAVVFVVGVVVAVDRGMRGDPVRERTVTAVAVTVPVAGALVVPVTMGFAWLVDYSTETPALLVEIVIVGTALAASAVAARRWAVTPMLGPVRLSRPRAPLWTAPE